MFEGRKTSALKVFITWIGTRSPRVGNRISSEDIGAIARNLASADNVP